MVGPQWPKPRYQSLSWQHKTIKFNIWCRNEYVKSSGRFFFHAESRNCNQILVFNGHVDISLIWFHGAGVIQHHSSAKEMCCIENLKIMLHTCWKTCLRCKKASHTYTKCTLSMISLKNCLIEGTFCGHINFLFFILINSLICRTVKIILVPWSCVSRVSLGFIAVSVPYALYTESAAFFCNERRYGLGKPARFKWFCIQVMVKSRPFIE